MKGWHRALLAAAAVVIILAPLTALYQGQQDAAQQRRSLTTQQRGFNDRQAILLSNIKARDAALLRGVQDLLDRPVISVRTIRREVNRKGVRTVVITRTLTKQAPPRVITRTVVKVVYRTKIVYICRLPNGHACKTSSHAASVWIGHWGSRALERRICVEDHTGRSWPVHAAARKWSQSSRIEYYFLADCGARRRKVKVFEVFRPDVSWAGYTTVLFDSRLHYTRVRVYLNSARPSVHRAIACHELGHAVGLGHNTSTSSCMYWAPTSPYPGVGDFRLLRYAVYAHRD